MFINLSIRQPFYMQNLATPISGIINPNASIFGNGYAKLWGVNKMHYGLCQNGYKFCMPNLEM